MIFIGPSPAFSPRRHSTQPVGVTLEVYNEMKRVATQNGSKTVTLLSTHKLVTARKVQGEPIPEANFSKLSLEKNETPFCDDSRS